MSLIALALSLVALSLVALTLALTLVALTPAKSVALIAAISVIPLIYASSSLLLSRSLLSRSLLGCSLLGCCLLGCKLLRGNVIGGRNGTCGLPSLCRHGLSWQTSRLSQKIIHTGQESLLIAGIFLKWLLGWETVPARPPPPASKWREAS